MSRPNGEGWPGSQVVVDCPRCGVRFARYRGVDGAVLCVDCRDVLSRAQASRWRSDADT